MEHPRSTFVSAFEDCRWECGMVITKQMPARKIKRKKQNLYNDMYPPVQVKFERATIILPFSNAHLMNFHYVF